MFDTIFTNIGTPTHKLMIRNENNYNLIFDSVYLAGKNNSGFRININGENLYSRQQLTLGAKDSLYIFLQAFIPENESFSFLREDSLVFISGKNTKTVKLIAFAQNAVHFNNENIQSQSWTNARPYLIYGTLTLDSGENLTIQEGTKIYMHRNSNLLIKGTVTILGSHIAPVKFSGDRSEKDYDTIPGQWGGIIIHGHDKLHSINYAVIQNATTGLQLGDYNNDDIVKAEVKNTIIKNMAYSSFIAYQADVSAENCVFANAGSTVCNLFSGSYSFLHCTLANYGAKYTTRSFDSKTLVIQNFIQENEAVTSKDLDKAYFGNSIIFGNSANEIRLEGKSDRKFNYTFENCLLKTTLTTNSSFINTIVNTAPGFISPEKELFSLDTLSVAKDAGNITIGQKVPFDINYKSRTNDLAPDLGAYERQE